MTQDATAAVLTQIDRNRDYLIDLTRRLVRIPTVNPKFETDPAINREPEIQATLRSEMDALGLETEITEVFPDRPNLTGRWAGSEERSLILNGHVDVVPVGDRALWSLDPFAAEIKDGRIYGRGALDMKSGVALNITVAKTIRDLGLSLEGRLDIHAVVDEEAGGFGSIDLVKRGRLAKAIIVTEPTWNTVQPAEGGLDWVRVTLKGRNAHTGWRYNDIYPQQESPGRLQPGVNAIEIAARLIEVVRGYERDVGARKRAHPLLPAGVNTISPSVMLGGAGLTSEGWPRGLRNLAITPDVAVVDFDLKFLPNEDPKEVRREFEALVHAFAQLDSWTRANPPVVQWDLYGLHFPPMNTPLDHGLVTAMTQARTALGLPTKLEGFVAVSDIAHYAGAGVAGVLHGPAGAGLHGADEFVEVASLVEAAKVVAATTIAWCGVRP
jgi:acetylornithine deacetylase